MYEQFFGLRERPFDLSPDPRFLVLTESHGEALSTLEYAIASRKGLTLLIGEAGLGKTTLLRAAIDKQPERVHVIYIQNPVLSRGEFVELLARRFGLSREAHASKTTLLVEIEELVNQARRMGETTLLVIDEAQSLPPELLEEVRLLANIETNSERLLSVIIAGQPELASRLNQPDLRQFKQRIALRCQLRRLTAEETIGYLAGRVSTAGGTGRDVFTRDAVAEIFRRSGGVPRTASVIADNALLAGFAAGTRPVTAQLVREVCVDLDLPEPTPERATAVEDSRGSEPVDTATALQLLRARVSLPAEQQPAVPSATRGKDAARPLFASFVRRRRFLFFGR